MAGVFRNDMNVLLVGTAGNGKSSVGNSLLKRKEFQVSSARQKVHTAAFAQSQHGTFAMKIADSVGVTHDQPEVAVKSIEQAITQIEGFDSILLVERFSGRYSDSDYANFKLLYNAFGPETARKYFIVVLTGGDMYEREDELQGVPARDWCLQQDGKFREMLRECGDRVILFDNVTNDENKKIAQVNELFNMINNLPSGGRKYTRQDFDKAEFERKRAVVELKKDALYDKFFAEADSIRDEIASLEGERSSLLKDKAGEDLLFRSKRFIAEIDSEDMDTQVLYGLRNMAKTLHETVVAKTSKYKTSKNVADRMSFGWIFGTQNVRRICIISGVLSGILLLIYFSNLQHSNTHTVPNATYVERFKRTVMSIPRSPVAWLWSPENKRV